MASDWYYAMSAEEAPVEEPCAACGAVLDVTDGRSPRCPAAPEDKVRFCAEAGFTPEQYAALERRRFLLRHRGLPVNREGWEVYLLARDGSLPVAEGRSSA